MNEALEIAMVARDVLGSAAEKELERFLKAYLLGTRFAGKVYAVGGYAIIFLYSCLLWRWV